MKESFRLFQRFLLGAVFLGGGIISFSPAALGANPSRITPRVLAVETFLADIAQNVAGERTIVGSLLPLGADPHEFEPAPADVAQVAHCDVLIVNGAGFEGFLQELLQNVGGKRLVIEASAGLASRPTDGGGDVRRTGHAVGNSAEAESSHSHGRDDNEANHRQDSSHQHDLDPHFWLDPNNVIRYVENIRNGLSEADPVGAPVYAANAKAYIQKLQALDRWIRDEVSQIPENRRLLVTNHESFGYFADRYGLRVVGTIIPSVSTDASPSAREMARLIQKIRETGAKAIFLEMGTNPQLAQQLARDTKTQVISDLYTHSVTAADGPAPTYLDMMKYNTRRIVEALK